MGYGARNETNKCQSTQKSTDGDWAVPIPAEEHWNGGARTTVHRTLLSSNNPDWIKPVGSEKPPSQLRSGAQGVVVSCTEWNQESPSQAEEHRCGLRRTYHSGVAPNKDDLSMQWKREASILAELHQSGGMNISRIYYCHWECLAVVGSRSQGGQISELTGPMQWPWDEPGSTGKILRRYR